MDPHARSICQHDNSNNNTKNLGQIDMLDNVNNLVLYHDLWEIRKINGTHTCVSTCISQGHTKLNSSFIANCIIHLVSEDPDIPIKELVKEVVIHFGYMVSRPVKMGRV
ncbi:hypothetical protein Lal_00021881 [Lupinus albus]|nr:hypothetical protein Lal_00021881 [Lupinus albus]